jgi:O-methyltransferase
MMYQKYRDRTMCSEDVFAVNLALARAVSTIPGAIVECGTWKGGMIAAIAETLGNNRKYFLCDSFQGLPIAREIDGPAAMKWQADNQNNCRASEDDVKESMKLAGITSYQIVAGWFDDTLPSLNVGPIALLRLDADWYGSTLRCLNYMFDRVAKGGIIIVDDYYVWDGCSRAVHRFLSGGSHTERIQSLGNVCYMVKT